MFAADKPDIKIAHASFCSLHDLKMKMRWGKPRNRGCRMLTSWTLHIVSKIFPFIYYIVVCFPQHYKDVTYIIDIEDVLAFLKAF